MLCSRNAGRGVLGSIGFPSGQGVLPSLATVERHTPHEPDYSRVHPSIVRPSRRPVRRPALRGVPILTSITLLVCTGACAPDASPEASFIVREVESPAGPASGQPSLETLDDGVLLAWTEAVAGQRHALRTAVLTDAGWSRQGVVVERDSLFVNWADFSLVKKTGPSTLAAHWLVRYPTGGAAYRIVTTFSTDGGRSWSEPQTPHEDGTVSEHGFVSWMGMPDGGTGLAWLDGRAYAESTTGSESEGHGSNGGQMSLQFRSVSAAGVWSDEVVLDPRTCDCCQTASAMTADGPIVAYRDRSEDEIRDIQIVRWSPNGWSAPVTVHEDGWRIAGCPVNGPALAAREEKVAIVWFSAADDTPRVKAAFSSDAGVTFGQPLVVDDGHPEGRVDALMTPDGGVWASWLERTQDGADVRLRRIDADGSLHPAITVAESSEARASGFPRMAFDPSGDLVIAWTDPTDPGTVRVARVQTTRP